MTTIDIDAIRKRLDAASTGPWTTGDDGLVWPTRLGDPVSGSTETADAEFIAHARTDIPALLAELDKVREVVEAAKAWRWSGDTADGHRRAEAALMAAVDALTAAEVTR